MGDKSLVRRHHPVLAVISNCYSEPKGRFPRVTHPCATRSEDLVRLACVRHAASVRSEPGSNSQVVVTTPCKKPKAKSSKPLTQHRTSGADTCISNVMDTKDIQTSAYLYCNPRAQRPPGAGAVAHMSLHLINNVKEPKPSFEQLHLHTDSVTNQPGKRPSRSTAETVKPEMVAGAGFEPATFRL